MTCLEKYLQEHPDENAERVPDDGCPHWHFNAKNYCKEYGEDNPLHSNCKACWGQLLPDEEAAETTETTETTCTTETVNHPKHYGRDGAMECIDEMILVFGTEATMHFCLLNAWKYRYRAGDKGGEEDMKKSDWYMAKYAELKGGDRA